MQRNTLRFAWLVCALGITTMAFAQTQRQTIRGEVTRFDAGTLHVKSATGQDVPVVIPDNVRIGVRAPATLASIKPGSFIGTTASARPDGTLLASEVHIFPESMRGTGEGHRPMASVPGSTMTNATVSGVSGAAAKPRGTMTNATVANVGGAGNARTLKLTYAGGQQTVVVPDNVPVVTVEPGDRASLSPGAHVIVYAVVNANGKLAAERISVGRNGSVPPI
jgi:hypothetical protein